MGRIAPTSEAYTYLPSSVRRFPGPEELGGRMAAAGLADVRWILTAGGIIAIHSGNEGMSNTAQAQLGSVLAAGGSELADLLERTEDPARAPVTDGHGARAGAATPAATLAAGGKRLRPVLVFLAADASPTSAWCAAGVAVELLHMATLVHDDVLDARRPPARQADRVRRTAGAPAATATGDLLFSRAFAELAGRGKRGRRAGALGRVVGARAG